MRTEVFNQIGLDSGALGLLGSVVHKFDEPGHYTGTALVGTESRGEFEIVVTEGEAPAAQIDLAATGKAAQDPCCDQGRKSYRVAPGAYVAFYVGAGNERWSTLVGDPRSRVAEFDSRKLEAGDLFAGSVLRPGTYQVRNTYGRGATELAVRYVRPGKAAYRPAEPVRVKVGDQTSRKAMRVGPAQGIVFEAADTSRIVVELAKPDDGVKSPS